MKIVFYKKEHFNTWNDFVEKSKNGTFLINRNFMDYHSDRFIDHSLMFYNEKDELMAILPANISNNCLYSHQGLTYGGLIMGYNLKSSQVLMIFNKIIDYCKTSNIPKIYYKPIPYIYHKYPSQEDLYALSVNNFILHRRDISTTISSKNMISFSKGKKSSASKANRNNVEVKLCYEYENFFEIVSEVLKKYNTKPTHTSDEIKNLADKFPKNIKLFGAFLANKLISGVLIFENSTTIHAQYISSNIVGRELGGVEVIIDYLINNYYIKFDFFDFGISNDPKNFTINEGLLAQKEMFGGRAVCYDHYFLNLNQ